MNFINILRKNVGTIVAGFGFLLLCILTFGDIGEILAEDYWESVWNNLTAISFVSIGLTFIQTAIKQGLAEQALQRGLNTDRTTEKYTEHKNIISDCNDRAIYLPYFLQIYNKRHTKLQRREFLVNNNYTSEKSLYASNQSKLIKEYDRIIVHFTATDLKWSTIDVVRDKRGRIITLDEHRKRRLRSSIMSSMIGMIGVTFLTGGLFFTPSEEPLWQKFVKLFTYCVAIAIGAIFTITKEYEKGAFGVPNDLDEINQIWYEFKTWDIPEWVIADVERLNQDEEMEEQLNEKCQRTVDERTDIQKEPKESENIQSSFTDNMVSISGSDTGILLVDDGK